MNGKTTGQVLTKEVTESGSSETTTIGRTGTATRTGIKKTRGTKVVKQSFGEKIVDIAYATIYQKEYNYIYSKRVKNQIQECIRSLKKLM